LQNTQIQTHQIQVHAAVDSVEGKEEIGDFAGDNVERQILVQREDLVTPN
jgi:hypothetical protein